MNSNPAPEKHDLRKAGRVDAVRIATVGAILVLAFGARVYYAYGLPLNMDELNHFQAAKEISLSPESFNLPLGNGQTNHPNGVPYLIAAANWIGNGSLFAIRVAAGGEIGRPVGCGGG